MNSRSVEFVRLAPSHLNALAALFRVIQADATSKFFHPHPFNDEEARRICLYQGEDKYHGIAIDGSMLGYGILRGWEEGFAVPSLGIYVAAALRGTGISRAFMEFLHVSARLSGADQIRLKVYPDNRPALGLYQSLGYVFSASPASDGQLLGLLNL